MFLKPDSFKGNVKSSPFSRGIIPVLSALDLLQTPHHQAIQQEIIKLLAQPDEFFQEAVTDLLENYAEFVQLIPGEDEPKLGGLLDLGLRRAQLVLELMREGEAVPEIHDPLFLYATFSAALLSEVSQVFVNKKIIFADFAGNYLNDWSPFTDSMLVQAEYYRVRPYYLPPAQISPYMTPLLARQLLPTAVFNWLANDLFIFEQWLAALSGDEERGGQVGYWLSRIKVKLVPSLHKTDGFPVKIHEASETELGDEFFDWLNENLVELTKRQKGIQVIENAGVRVAFPLLFREFCQTKNNVEPDKVLQEFKRLGILAENASPAVDLYDKQDRVEVNAGARNPQEGKKSPADFFRRSSMESTSRQTVAITKQAQSSATTLNPEIEKALWFFVAKEWLAHKAWQKITKDAVGKLNLADRAVQQLRRLHRYFSRKITIHRMESKHK